MSVQFGIWNFDGEAPSREYIEKVGTTLAPYGPDSNERYANGGMTILYRAFHTTRESHRELQPHVSASGAVITWDGRLDNRAELIDEVRGSLNMKPSANQLAWRDTLGRVGEAGEWQPTSGELKHDADNSPRQITLTNSAPELTDAEIVAAVYEQRGGECLGRLIGDWALSIWNPCERWVILAKDPMGKRHLYYSFDKKQITWSTILSPLVLFAGKTFEICEEYIAGWFSPFPAAHLTPYVGIHAVPPSASVEVRSLKKGVKHTVRKYWDFDPSKKIRYHTDAEYEEHFRTVFATAVRRSLRSDRPILAELSGGMDSASIVCMADLVMARADATTPRLDTISWYVGNPDLNEYPYFTKVEEKRGRTGCHIDLGLLKQIDSRFQRSLASEFENDCFAATPDSAGLLEEFFIQYAAYMTSQGNRVVLSGIGGNEVTGGSVPTPRQELQNLLARARFGALAQQLNVWSVKMRKRRIPMLWEAVSGFFSLSLSDQVTPQSMRLVPWFDPGFVRRNRAALCGYPSRVRLFGPLPSVQDNLVSLAGLRRVLAYYALQSKPLRDLRYPYLDRDLLEFLCAIPRQQIVRPAQRRSLMRRALVGIVPNELLNRRRNALVATKSTNDNLTWPSWVEVDQYISSSSLRIVDRRQLSEALRKAALNDGVSIGGLRRTLTFVFWLRHLAIRGILLNPLSTKGAELLAL